MRVRIGDPGTMPTTPSADAPRTLADPTEPDPTTLGAKAANLSTAWRRRLPVVDGFVVPVPLVDAHPALPPDEVRHPWAELSAGGAVSVVVRSSAPGEDLAATSMAGIFDSVIDVAGWEDFTRAYARVVATAGGGPMAVLVQRFVRPRLGGVIFGIDPISGLTDRMVIVAVDGGPHRLVAGEVEGRRTVVDRAGRVHERDGDPGPVLSSAERSTTPSWCGCSTTAPATSAACTATRCSPACCSRTRASRAPRPPSRRWPPGGPGGGPTRTSSLAPRSRWPSPPRRWVTGTPFPRCTRPRARPRRTSRSARRCDCGAVGPRADPVDVGAHAMDRLRGGLNDATFDRVRSRVVRMETAAAS